jgi:uncharacterized damage-inducible protein DinB
MAASMLDQFKLFARYNRLMNERILEAAAKLPVDDLSRDRGAFFKSVLGTLNHVLVGDIIWLKRFAAHPPSREALARLDDYPQPESLDAILCADLDSLATQRARVDAVIADWIAGLEESALEDRLAYRNMAGKPHNKPLASLISHLFLHQVHHRGQATTLISQSGEDFGDTDLLELIDDFAG